MPIRRTSTALRSRSLLILASLTLVTTLSSCTLDGGTGNANKERTMASTEREYLTVSKEPGVEPKIGQPVGNAPTTLVQRDIIVGTGAEVLPTSTLTAHYVLLSWKTGKVLQSSWAGQPPIFPLSNVIKGWQQGMPGMKVGGRRLLIVPPDLAYGASGGGPIGPDETIVFVVDLVNVN